MTYSAAGGRHAAPSGRARHRTTRRRSRRGRRPGTGATLLGLAGGLSLVLSAFLVLHARGDTALGQIPASPAAENVGATVGTTLPLPLPAGSPAAAPGGFTPGRLVIPRLAVDAAVIPVSVGADRSLGVPDNPAVLGWWRDGAWPGQPGGSVVIDGHVDSVTSGPGALFRLQALVPGDVVMVSGPRGSVRYVVAARRQYAKATLPTSIFDQQVGARLVLVTCGGRFDAETRHYADNVVVFARPA